MYDFIKGDTDECDQWTESYSVKPKSRKWTIASFSYILDMARIDAATVLYLSLFTIFQNPFAYHLLKSDH